MATALLAEQSNTASYENSRVCIAILKCQVLCCNFSLSVVSVTFLGRFLYQHLRNIIQKRERKATRYTSSGGNINMQKKQMYYYNVYLVTIGLKFVCWLFFELAHLTVAEGMFCFQT